MTEGCYKMAEHHGNLYGLVKGVYLGPDKLTSYRLIEKRTMPKVGSNSVCVSSVSPITCVQSVSYN